MPGVLQEEAMLQAAMVLIYLDNKNKKYEFMLFKTNSTFLKYKGSCNL